MAHLTDTARRLRKEQTSSERILWRRLRARQMKGAKWRRQQVIGDYIVDFFCPELRVAVELDGDTHAGRDAQDEIRQQYLSAQGLTVLRYTNDDIRRNLEGVLSVIWEVSGEREVDSPSP